MDQQTGHVASKDGTRVAYAVAGNGFPLVRAATWVTHVDHDLDHPAWAHWWRELANDHLFIRYDQRGCGGSDRDVPDVSLEARVEDLAAVVDDLGLAQFDLLGHSHGAPVALAYAATFPERVRRLVLFNGYARGPFVSSRQVEMMEGVWQLIDTAWEAPRTRRMFAGWMIPGGAPNVIDAMVELLELSTSANRVVDVLSTGMRFDVTSYLRSVTAPTLVMQSVHGEINPASESRILGALLPNAITADIESRNNILLSDEPGWQTFVREFRSFCAAPDEALSARAAEEARHHLSPREVQVLRLVADGNTDRSIAETLGISARTVSNHVKSILQKTETANRAHAVAWSAKRGLL